MGFFKKLRMLLIGGKKEDFFFVRKLIADWDGERSSLDWTDSHEAGFSALGDRYDVCLLDCTSGEQSVVDFISRTGGRDNFAPIILLVPNGADKTWSEAFFPGALDWLTKEELNGATLRRAIRYAVERKKAQLELAGYRRQVADLTNLIGIPGGETARIGQSLLKTREELETGVRKRTEELADANLTLMVEIAERKQAEQALRLNEKRLQALLNLGQIPWSSEEQIVRYVLEQELKLTRSEAGAIGFLDYEAKIVKWCAVITTPAMAGSPHYFDTPIEKAGAWGEAIKNCQPVVANEVADREEGAKGLPFFPTVFRRFLSIPVCLGERTIAVGLVANKRGCYDQPDLLQSTLLMDGMWKLIERERSMKALKDAENLAGIGRALSSVAHDMKTPLIAIGGFTKQVERGLSPTDPSRAKTEIILKETERLQQMVEDMLDFSKPLELRKSFEQIGPILEESVAITKPLADAKRIELRIEAVGPLSCIPIDPIRIKRVFINLITNAIQASPEGQVVRIVHRRSGKYLIIDVSDSGPGIPREIRKDIFAPFFTTRKGGTGLGLPIVKKVIEAHKGGIEVLNSPGGTTFRLRVPS